MENPISITMINDFVFCPVSIYFHSLYDGVERNLYQDKSQINGTKSHETIDSVYIFIMDSRTEIKRFGYAKNEEKEIIVI